MKKIALPRLMTMRAALEDPDIFGTNLPGDTWAAWRIILIASQGEELTEAEREVFQALTGREREPTRPCREIWGVVGRRGGKTRAFAVAAAYFARLIDYEGAFAPGQRGRVPVMAASKEQAREAFNYLVGIFQEVPAFAEMLDGEPTAETIRLKNRVDIQVLTASYRTARGFTPVAAVADEIAFWWMEGAANPDTEVLRALRPGLATFGGPLFVLSSPYARKGELWKTYDKHYGERGDPRILVVQAPTLTMHPSETLAEEVEAAYSDDPASARAEWGAEFRKDVEAFVTVEAVRACTDTNITERPAVPGTRYFAFMDVSGGGADAMALAIAHREDKTAVLDAVREMPALTSPSAVVEAFAELLRSYGIREVRGDRYGKAWVQERFRDEQIGYVESEQSKSEIYGAWLPILNSGRCRLLSLPKLETQLISLERRTTRGTGRDVIDHPQKKGAHDDLANAVCGALVMASQRKLTTMDLLGDDTEAAAFNRAADFRRNYGFFPF